MIKYSELLPQKKRWEGKEHCGLGIKPGNKEVITVKTDYRTVKVEVKEGVAILKLNNPPVNQLSKPFVKEMANAITETFQDQEVKAVILTGTGKNFIAGADITEIKGVADKDDVFSKVMDNHRFMNAIEDGSKPVIAAFIKR